MSTNFDAEIPLRNIHSAKWDMHGPATGATGDDVIPMWVADMDFRAPQSVLDVMQAEIDRGVMGYYGNDVSLRQAIMNWYDQRHGWSLKPEWLYFSHGVVAGLGLVLEAFTKPGDVTVGPFVLVCPDNVVKRDVFELRRLAVNLIDFGLLPKVFRESPCLDVGAFQWINGFGDNGISCRKVLLQKITRCDKRFADSVEVLNRLVSRKRFRRVEHCHVQ